MDTGGGISKLGEHAEALFRRFARAEAADKKSDGDAVLEGRLVEIKACTPKNRNLNQVRAYKYLPLVVYVAEPDDDDGLWYVVPAHCIAEIAAGHGPQHALDAFECMHLNVTKDWAKYLKPAAELRAACLNAFAEDDEFEELRGLMHGIGADGRARAGSHRRTVKSILEAHGAN